ncbi:MAG TPA: MoxR family ATPase [Chloroflexota bacterium]|nr:MoxR family ATPase [Chloroflexota bacterium]
MPTSIAELAGELIANVEKVIVGKRDVVELTLVALLCQGHVLIEDVPGVGKTTLAKAFARSLGSSFKRIQFTPDLLPTDITGNSVFNQRTTEFEFRPGPVFAQMVLADEINRATPKTQSALLECMEERQVTVEGASMPMPEPFLVLATQNPIEYEGTFVLPEAQLDRFLIRIKLGYPAPAHEIQILDMQQMSHPLEKLEQVIDARELIWMEHEVRNVYLDPTLREYIVQLVGATRSHADVYLGASPRGSLALFKTAQALAAIRGRDYVTPDDVKAMAEPALAHRIIINPASRMKDFASETVVDEALKSVPVPGVRAAR